MQLFVGKIECLVIGIYSLQLKSSESYPTSTFLTRFYTDIRVPFFRELVIRRYWYFQQLFEHPNPLALSISSQIIPTNHVRHLEP